MENKTKQEEINGQVVGSNFIWRFLERFGSYIVSFIVSIVLARILDPSSYGIVAIITVIITFLDVFVTGGFANSLIYHKDATEKDFNTLLIFNCVFSFGLYIILFFTAPLIADFYEKPSLVPLIRVLGITLLTSGIKNLQYAFTARELKFKKFFYATIIGIILSGIAGIVFALLGFGAWALVIHSVLNQAIDVIILAFIIGWKPKIQFDKSIFKKHFKFGSKILISKIAYWVSNNVRQLIIGKKYSDADLAFYNKGKTYPNIFGQNITTSINSVIFPVLSKLENNLPRFNYMLKKSFQINMYIILPMMLGLFCISDSFIELLIGSQWLESTPYLRIFCFVVIFNTIEAIFSSCPLALGKSTLSMIFEIGNSCVNVIALLVSIQFGIKAMALSLLASSAFSAIVFLILTKKLTNFKILNCFGSCYKTFIASILMFAAVFSLSYINIPFYFLFFIQLLSGIIVYLLTNIILKNSTQAYCFDFLKKRLKIKKKK